MATNSHLPAGLKDAGATATVQTEFVCGSAGTGKTFEMRRRIAEDSNYAVLASTTGISAMNLGTITINSLLKYFDTESLQDKFFNGYLVRQLRDIAESGVRNIVIDEISMMDATQLDIIYQAVKQLNEQQQQLEEQQLGIVLTGDFMQLSPVKARWAFEAECWPEFEQHTTRLTKIWRQADARFLEALASIRRGEGQVGAAQLQNCGVEFVRNSYVGFDGTTIMAKNKAVDNFNWLTHSKLVGVPIFVQSKRWGQQFREWDNVPQELGLKLNSYVMILSNDTPLFSYVNGDCGHIREYDADKGFAIELVRNGQIVWVPQIQRRVELKNPPDELLTKHRGSQEGELRKLYRAYDNPDSVHWI